MSDCTKCRYGGILPDGESTYCRYSVDVPKGWVVEQVAIPIGDDSECRFLDPFGRTKEVAEPVKAERSDAPESSRGSIPESPGNTPVAPQAVEPPAPRPMKLRAAAYPFGFGKKTLVAYNENGTNAGVYDTMPGAIADEIAYRVNSFEAPEAQAGEAP